MSPSQLHRQNHYNHQLAGHYEPGRGANFPILQRVLYWFACDGRFLKTIVQGVGRTLHENYCTAWEGRFWKLLCGPRWTLLENYCTRPGTDALWKLLYAAWDGRFMKTIVRPEKDALKTIVLPETDAFENYCLRPLFWRYHRFHWPSRKCTTHSLWLKLISLSPTNSSPKLFRNIPTHTLTLKQLKKNE